MTRIDDVPNVYELKPAYEMCWDRTVDDDHQLQFNLWVWRTDGTAIPSGTVVGTFLDSHGETQELITP